MAEFKNGNEVNIGEVKAGSSGNIVFWSFEDYTSDDILRYEEGGELKWGVAVTCGCSKNVTVTEDGVGLSFSPGNTKGHGAKKIRVYPKAGNEGKEVRLKNAKGRMKFNPELEFFKLVFKYETV